MNASVRILYNTLSLYGKMIITTIISLYLTRVVLNYLGTSDFGLYSLIGGIISLLSFVNSALMVSTQRFLSVALGENNTTKIKNIFSAGILIHFVLTVILIIAFELCSVFLFDGFLNIEPNRIHAAKVVYQLMIISTAFTVLGVPYNAMINAKEDLWLFSLIETLCAILKIGIIVIFHYSQNDTLITYTLWIVVITIINFFLKYIWCRTKYNECKKLTIYTQRNTPLMREMISFSGWNALGTLALIGRNQGVAILLNIFWGTTINAVYGIANQVNSQLIYFSTMMTTSMTPQIMKSHGEGNRTRMLDLSVFTCKLSFFLSAVLAIPLLLELPFVLTLWLKTVPEHTDIFCSLIIYIFLLMQLYPGLDRAIQASGKIKWYQILAFSVLLLPIPLGIVLGQSDAESYSIIYLMIISQAIQMCVAIYMAKRLVGLHVMPFVAFIIKAGITFSVIYIGGKYLYQQMSAIYNEWVTFGVVVSTTMLTFSLVYYLFVFGTKDREKMRNVACAILKRK